MFNSDTAVRHCSAVFTILMVGSAFCAEAGRMMTPWGEEAMAFDIQTTDVEIEINGLMTYDRKVLKSDPKVLRAAHQRVISAATEAAR